MKTTVFHRFVHVIDKIGYVRQNVGSLVVNAGLFPDFLDLSSISSLNYG